MYFLDGGNVMQVSCKAYSTGGTSLESYTSNRLYLGVACVADNMHITIYKPAI